MADLEGDRRRHDSIGYNYIGYMNLTMMMMNVTVLCFLVPFLPICSQHCLLLFCVFSLIFVFCVCTFLFCCCNVFLWAAVSAVFQPCRACYM